MKRTKFVRTLLYLTLLLAMMVSALTLGTPIKIKAESGDACCSTASDCKTKAAPKCCYAGPMEADCSQAKPNYCRNTCG